MDQLHTIDSFHDGRPLSGTADFRGQPHFYQCQFDEESDDWSDRYVLKKMGVDLLALALERQEIFLKWRKALDDGKVAPDTHPLLAADHPRYNELENILTKKIAGLPETVQVIGRFDDVSFDRPLGTVQWIPLCQL